MTKVAIVIFAVSITLVVLAFWPMYFSRPFAATDSYTHFHAILGSVWLALLIMQPLAIHNYRYSLHRWVGRSSYILAPLFFIAGILLSHHRLVSMDEATFTNEGYSHFLPFYASVVFAVAYLLGVRYRQLPEAHGRFMLCTGVPLIDPVIGRILFFYFPSLPHPLLYQAVTFSLATAIAGILVFSYRGQRSPKRALVGYFVLLVTLELAWFTFASTFAWFYLVAWFRELPLT